MRGVVVAVLLAATPAASADQFDLACKGYQQGGAPDPKHPLERHYRIDLTTGRWCTDACATVSQLHAVEPDRIVFTLKVPAFPRRDMEIRHVVSRQDGRLVDMAFRPGYSSSYVATCEVVPFTGLPAPKF